LNLRNRPARILPAVAFLTVVGIGLWRESLGIEAAILLILLFFYTTTIQSSLNGWVDNFTTALDKLRELVKGKEPKHPREDDGKYN
jgi:hypothetical protein